MCMKISIIKDSRWFIYFWIFLILKQLISYGICQLPKSPCPKYFQYYQDEMSDEIMGIIKIPSPLPRNVPLMLKVAFNFPTVLPTKYNGSFELIKSKKIHAPVQQAIDQGKSLFFQIKFPVQGTIPFIKEITFNNRPKCLGPIVNWPIVTIINYEKTIYPPELLSLLYNQTNFNNFDNYKKSILPIESNFENNENCGLSKNANLTIDIRFNGGEIIYPGQWPWLAAILILSKTNFEFQCIGNLISKKHIITAAHCLKQNGMDVSVNAVSILLGKYFLEIPNESGSLEEKISDIKIHPNFNNIFHPNADSDLAILILKKSVEYTITIQPICLWKKSINFEKIIGKSGIVVGWGKYGKRYTGVPRMTNALIVSQEDCLRSDSRFVRITSNRTFCAGNRNGNDPCSGDSGSGFSMLDSETGRFYLRGIVSFSLFDRKTNSCDSKQYIVYVDIAKYLDWIKSQISSDFD